MSDADDIYPDFESAALEDSAALPPSSQPLSMEKEKALILTQRCAASFRTFRQAVPGSIVAAMGAWQELESVLQELQAMPPAGPSLLPLATRESASLAGGVTLSLREPLSDASLGDLFFFSASSGLALDSAQWQDCSMDGTGEAVIVQKRSTGWEVFSTAPGFVKCAVDAGGACTRTGAAAAPDSQPMNVRDRLRKILGDKYVEPQLDPEFQARYQGIADDTYGFTEIKSEMSRHEAETHQFETSLAQLLASQSAVLAGLIRTAATAAASRKTAAKSPARQPSQDIPPLQWYYLKAGAPAGPISEEELLGLLRAGLIPWETLVWNAKLSDWQQAAVTELRLKAAPPSVLAQEGPPSLAAPVCSNCGKTLAAGARFCNHCGATAAVGTSAPATRPAFCPRCSATVRLGARFCSTCGQEIS